MFSAPKGGYLRYDNFRDRMWVPATEDSRYGSLVLHGLRHTAAALMISGGANALRVKRGMSHETFGPRTTSTACCGRRPGRGEAMGDALFSTDAVEENLGVALSMPAKPC